MAFVSITPTANSVVATGNTFVVTWSSATLPWITFRPSNGPEETVYSPQAGGMTAGAGFTVVSDNLGGGLYSVAFRRDAGWTGTPFVLSLWDQLLFTETQVSYTLLAEGQYPPDMQPFNDPVEGTGASEGTLDGVVATTPRDNDVDVPASDPIIFRDGNVDVTPVTIVKGDRTTGTPALQIDLVTSGGQAGLDHAIGIDNAADESGLVVKPSGILFNAVSTSTVYSIDVLPNNADGEGGGQLNISAGDNVHATGLQGGNLRLDAGSGVLANGKIRIGGFNDPDAIEITDSTGSTGETSQVLTSDGSGNSTWEDATGGPATASLDDTINYTFADNDVNVPLTDPVILRDAGEDITPFSVIKIDTATSTVPAIAIEYAGQTTPAIHITDNSAGSASELSIEGDSIAPGKDNLSGLTIGLGATVTSGAVGDVTLFGRTSGEEGGKAGKAMVRGGDSANATDGDGGDVELRAGFKLITGENGSIIIGNQSPKEILFGQGFTVTESADHPVATPENGKGQFWVNTDGQPMYTSPADAVSDPGTDHDLSAGAGTLEDIITTAPIDNALVVPSVNPIIFSDGSVVGLSPLSVVKAVASATVPALDISTIGTSAGVHITDTAGGGGIEISNTGVLPSGDTTNALVFGGGEVDTVVPGATLLLGKDSTENAQKAGSAKVIGGDNTNATAGDGGDVEIDPGTFTTSGVNGDIKIGSTNAPNEILFAQGFTVAESANPPLGTTPTGTGQFWVNDATSPPKPYFTGDDDIDIDLTAGSGVGDVTSTASITANKIVIGDSGGKTVKQAPLGSLSDAGALTAIATIATTSDITSGNDVIATNDVTSTVDVNVGVNLNVPTGDIVMGATGTVDGRNLAADATVWQGHLDTVTGNPHDVEGVEVLATGATDTYVLTASGGASVWAAGGTGSGNVSAALNITDNTIVRGDGGTKNVQESGIAISDTEDITGVADLTLTGDITVGGTVDGVDIGVDVAGHLADVTTNPHNVTIGNLGSALLSDLNVVVADATLHGAHAGGDVTGNETLTIEDGAVTLAKMAGMATQSFLGRESGGAGLVEVLDGDSATALLTNFSTTTTTSGTVPGSNGGTSSVFLNATGAWSTPAGAGDVSFQSGTVVDNQVARFHLATGTLIQGGTTQPTIDDSGSIGITAGETVDGVDVSELSDIANMAQNTFAGRITASTGAPEELNQAEATSILNEFAKDSSTQGVVPASAGGTTDYLRADGTWDVPPGGSGINPNGTTAQDAAYFTERANNVNTPAAGLAELWVLNVADQDLKYTNDSGEDDTVMVAEDNTLITTGMIPAYNATGHRYNADSYMVSVDGDLKLLHTTTASLTMRDRVSGPTNAADKGKWWVKNAVPNEPWFTDDLGNNTKLNQALTKSITVENPTTSEDITMFFTPVAITITNIRGVTLGSTTTINFDLYESDFATRGSTTAVNGSGITADNDGVTDSSFTNPGIAANSWVSLQTTTGGSGSPTELHVTLTYTED